MSKNLEDVLTLCSRTASWFGVELRDINSINLMEDTPLHTVCSWGGFECVKILIDAGSNVNAKGDNGCTPLFNAVIGGNQRVIELLVDSGAIASLRNDDGRSVFEYAKNIGSSKEVIDFLKKLRS